MNKNFIIKQTNIKKLHISQFKKVLLIDENTLKDSYKINKIIDKTAEKLNKEKLITAFIPSGLNDIKTLKVCLKLNQLCSIYESVFLVKNRLDIAKIIDCNGIILDFKSININKAKRIIDEEKFFAFYDSKIKKTNSLLKKFDLLINDYIIETLKYQ